MITNKKTIIKDNKKEHVMSNTMNTITINKKKDFIEYGVEVYFIENDTRLTDSVWSNKEDARERARELNSSNDVFITTRKVIETDITEIID